jgi:hypothetical protein
MDGKEIDFDEGDIGDCTYNLAPMFNAAIESCNLKIEGIRGFNKQTAKDVIGPLKKMLAEMEGNPLKYKKLNPANGWGDYDGAVETLRELCDACINYPSASICIV